MKADFDARIGDVMAAVDGNFIIYVIQSLLLNDICTRCLNRSFLLHRFHDAGSRN